MKIQLTEKQQQGLEIALQRFKDKERYTTIAGGAGCGKSTLIREIAKQLPVPSNEIAYCTPTGKAAQVLVAMGNEGATTIHRLLWTWHPKTNGGYYRVRNTVLPRVVICDEVSMISAALIDELLSHKETYVIFCGDPYQLPPIYADDDNHLLDNPHIFLDEVMRQAQDSDIIKLSMAVRHNEFVSYEELNHGEDVRIFKKKALSNAMLLWADVIICATNNTRKQINSLLVQLLGYQKDLDNGMKIICTRNYWDILSDKGEPLINGTIGIIENMEEGICTLPNRFLVPSFPIIKANLRLENGDVYRHLTFSQQELLTGQPIITDKALLYKINQYYYKAHLTCPLPINGELGYAITCHKSQGSQWEKVLVVEERFPFEPEEHQRWLYTAITRPMSKLTLITRY